MGRLNFAMRLNGSVPVASKGWEIFGDRVAVVYSQGDVNRLIGTLNRLVTCEDVPDEIKADLRSMSKNLSEIRGLMIMEASRKRLTRKG